MISKINKSEARYHHEAALTAQNVANGDLSEGRISNALVHAQLATMHATLAVAITNCELVEAQTRDTDIRNAHFEAAADHRARNVVIDGR